METAFCEVCGEGVAGEEAAVAGGAGGVGGGVPDVGAEGEAGWEGEEAGGAGGLGRHFFFSEACCGMGVLVDGGGWLRL